MRTKEIKKVEGKNEVEIKEISTVIHTKENIDAQVEKWERVLKFWKDMQNLIK